MMNFVGLTAKTVRIPADISIFHFILGMVSANDIEKSSVSILSKDVCKYKSEVQQF